MLSSFVHLSGLIAYIIIDSFISLSLSLSLFFFSLSRPQQRQHSLVGCACTQYTTHVVAMILVSVSIYGYKI